MNTKTAPAIFLFTILLTVSLSVTTGLGSDIDSMLNEAWDYMDAGEYGSALDLLEQVLGEDDTLPFVHYDIGVCLEETSHFAEAADHYEIYLEMEPDAENTDETRLVISELRELAGSGWSDQPDRENTGIEESANILLLVFPVVDYSEYYVENYLVDDLASGADYVFYHKAYGHLIVGVLGAVYGVVFDENYGDADGFGPREMCIAIPFKIAGLPRHSINPNDIGTDYSGKYSEYCLEPEEAESQIVEWFETNYEQLNDGVVCAMDVMDGAYGKDCIDAEKILAWADVGKNGLKEDSYYSAEDLAKLQAYSRRYALVFEVVEVNMSKSAITVKYKLFLYDLRAARLISETPREFYYDLLDRGFEVSFSGHLQETLRKHALSYFEEVGVDFLK